MILTGTSNRKSRTERGNFHPEWMALPPPKGTPETKVKKTKTCHWCSRKIGSPSIDGCNLWGMHLPTACNSLHNRNITKKGKVETPKSSKCKAELTVKLATVSLKRTKISSNTDEHHDPPTSSDESVSTIPVDEYDSD